MISTATQYLGNAAAVVAKELGNDPKLTERSRGEGNRGWLSELKSAFTLRAIAIAAKRGEEICGETLAVGRAAVEEICRHQMRIGSTNSFCNRDVFVTLRQAIGRAVEVGLASYLSASWDSTIEKLVLPWIDTKTGKVVPMPFGADLLYYVMCFYHAMGCMMIVGYASTRGSGKVPWFFPNIAELAE